MTPKKHPFAGEASTIKQKRFNKLFTEAFREAPEQRKDLVMQAMQQPDILMGEVNMEKQNILTDLVQDYLNQRASKRTKTVAGLGLPALSGAAVYGTSKQPRYVPGVSGAPGPHRLTNLERFARMLGLGPY